MPLSLMLLLGGWFPLFMPTVMVWITMDTRALWIDLNSHELSVEQSPWLPARDFNVVLSPLEHMRFKKKQFLAYSVKLQVVVCIG